MDFSAMTRIFPSPNGVPSLKAQPKFGNWTDGEAQHEDAFAYVEHKARAAVAARVMEQPLPHFDYVRGAFNGLDAQAFAETVFDVGEEGLSGLTLLQKLMSPVAADPDNEPQRDRMTSFDFPQYGVSEHALRGWMEDSGASLNRLMPVLNEARRGGLIYQLTDHQAGMTYYGVPPRVRQTLDLSYEQGPQDVGNASVETEEPEALSQFQAQLFALLEQTDESLGQAANYSDERELFEYVAQVAAGAIEKGLLQMDDLPPTYMSYFQEYGAEERLDGALLTAFELSREIQVEHTAISDLADLAVTLGILQRDDLLAVS